MPTLINDTNGHSNGRSPKYSTLRDSLLRDGYVIIPNALSEAQLTQLREAASRASQAARDGKWPHVRTLPKQFPPWGSDASQGIWGYQHLMHPDQPDAAIFAESYFMDAVMKPAKEIMSYKGVQTTDEDLIMELYNMLLRPTDDFELRWHRDDIPPTATAEEEIERLGHEAWHTQWNLPLFEDDSLVVVPGSHKRPRTTVERDADPFAKELPGISVVKMNPGDIVFYDNNILHRGVYSKNKERMTLHGSVGHMRGESERARNVLQHGVGFWIEKADFSSLPADLKKRAEGMRKRLFELAQKSGDVGFSQPTTEV